MVSTDDKKITKPTNSTYMNEITQNNKIRVSLLMISLQNFCLKMSGVYRNNGETLLVSVFWTQCSVLFTFCSRCIVSILHFSFFGLNIYYSIFACNTFCVIPLWHKGPFMSRCRGR